jgi:hypothetical protein
MERALVNVDLAAAPPRSAGRPVPPPADQVQLFVRCRTGTEAKNGNSADKGGPNSTAQLYPKGRLRGEDTAHPNHGLEKADQEPQHLLQPHLCHMVPRLPILFDLV